MTISTKMMEPLPIRFYDKQYGVKLQAYSDYLDGDKNNPDSYLSLLCSKCYYKGRTESDVCLNGDCVEAARSSGLHKFSVFFVEVE